MLTQEAIVYYVNSIIYRPGWTFTPEASDWNNTDVTVNINHPVLDSSYPPMYPLELPHGFDTYCVIDGSTVDTVEDVGRIVLEAVISHEREMIVHEAREFFRIDRGDGTYPALFHPHQFASFSGPGRANWDRTKRFQLESNKSLPYA